jgi:ABC-type multidrug transport system fused ATPase/permease subunit
MAGRREFPRLRQRLGDDGMFDLRGMLDDTSREWKEDVLQTAGDRYERRLSEELGKFRVAKEFAAVRAEITNEFAAIRVEMVTARVSMLRWMFALWASAILAIVLK